MKFELKSVVSQNPETKKKYFIVDLEKLPPAEKELFEAGDEVMLLIEKIKRRINNEIN